MSENISSEQSPSEDNISSSLGEIAWLDLTVTNASEVRDFYQQVVGWQVQEVSMGDYSDYSMIQASTEQPVAGVCHARGPNADLPPVWLPYFLVVDVEQSVANVTRLGGKLVTPVKSMGSDKFAVVQDPAGASCALYQKG